MNSKTPEFDKALDKILKDLKPHVRECKKCAQNFEIFKEDIEFYHKLRVNSNELMRLKNRLFGINWSFVFRGCPRTRRIEDPEIQEKNNSQDYEDNTDRDFYNLFKFSHLSQDLI